MKIQAEMKDIKDGKYLLIDEEPCVVVSTAHSKPGKHGAAKQRVEAIGLFDGVKRSVVQPVDAKVYIPVVERKSVQILNIVGDTAQLMDLATYANFELKIPPELQGKLQTGQDVTLLTSMGRMKFDVRGEK